MILTDDQSITFQVIIACYLLFYAEFPDYTTFADIHINKRGFRNIHLNYYTFGFKETRSDRTYWSCTKTYRDKNDQRRRCKALLVTKTLNGYEMIQSTNIKHDPHPSALAPRFQ